MAVTAASITRYLLRVHHREAYVLPRYTPRKWWECDVFLMTKSGYFREFEIKMTRADFLKDAAKTKTYGTDRRTKHQRLAARCPFGPTRFTFCAPAGVIPLELVPEWAGLLEFTTGDEAPYGPYPKTIKRAPALHRKPLDPLVPAHLWKVCYYRLHNVWNGTPSTDDR